MGNPVMRYLLDTHILLWSLLDPEKLPAGIAQILSDPNNDLWISPITVWEILVLAEKGRLKLEASTPSAWVREMLDTVPLKEAPLNCEIALASRSIDLSHQDPADRFIAATALVYDLVLITVDERLLASRQLQTLKLKS
jgi:PIN domain nuclease of toxin-antitoxin system